MLRENPYYCIMFSIKPMQNELAKLYDKRREIIESAESTTTQLKQVVSFSSIPSNKVADAIEKLDAIQNRIDELAGVISDRKIKIQSLINLINDDLSRKIIYCRCIKCLSVSQTAQMLGISYKTVASRTNKVLSEILAKNVI